MTLAHISTIVNNKKLKFGHLTVNEIIEIALEAESKVSDVIIAEAMEVTGKTENEVFEGIKGAFDHNFKALKMGLEDGNSYLLGTVGSELESLKIKKIRLFADEFVDDAVRYTLGSQVGNHEMGLEPCAGTGDSCGYTGFARAVIEHSETEDAALRAIAIMVKIGTLYRVGKTTTGCNMEGFGAAAAATAAALVEFEGGTPEQLGRAVTLAVSPTIAVPCTPRISVPGLCATHIAGAILIGTLSARLVRMTDMPVTTDPDSMIAMAAAVHPVSAKYVVPITIDYMLPFFKTNSAVESFVDQSVRDAQNEHSQKMKEQVAMEVRTLASKANPITKPFGAAVVGGSSQAVGSPTNMGRIANKLIKGAIKKITIEIYPELFSRRGTNVPGILMGAVLGAKTDDVQAYRSIMQKVTEMGIAIEIRSTETPQAQKITIETTEGTYWVDTRNRGGGRINLVAASSSLEDITRIAKELGIETVD